MSWPPNMHTENPQFVFIVHLGGQYRKWTVRVSLQKWKSKDTAFHTYRKHCVRQREFKWWLLNFIYVYVKFYTKCCWYSNHKKIRERNHLLDLCTDGRMLLQHILNKQEINVWTLFSGHWAGKIGDFYNYDNEFPVLQKQRIFWPAELQFAFQNKVSIQSLKSGPLKLFFHFIFHVEHY